MNYLQAGGTLLLCALLWQTPPIHAAGNQFEIDIKELEKKETSPAAKPAKKEGKAKRKKAAAARAGKGASSKPSGYLRYTVKPGDHIFKILMTRFGMTDEEAEKLIPEIKRLNKITDIKKLRVGQTLLIPAKGKTAETGQVGSGKGAEAPGGREGAVTSEQEKPTPQGATEAHEGAAAAPAAPVAPPSAAERAPSEATWICSVTDNEPARIVDSVLNALSVPWTRNKIIESGEKAATTFSIRVDRYFEYKGDRYIVSIGETDPYNYTLIRLLESSGYRTLGVTGADDFRAVTEKLLKLMGVAMELAKHSVQGGKELTGFLVRQDDAGGRRVLITGDHVDPRQKRVMKPGCSAK